MSDLEKGIREEVNFVLECMEEEIELTENQMNKVVARLLDNDSLWEQINETIEEEIYKVIKYE